MDGIVFLAEESERTSLEPWRLLCPHPSIFLFALLCAGLLFRHISAPLPFLSETPNSLKFHIFTTPFDFPATSSFLLFPPIIFFFARLLFQPPQPHPFLSPSVFSVCSFTVGPTTEPPRLRLDAASQLTLAGRHTRSPGKISCFSMLKCQALNKPLWGSKVRWSGPPRTDPVHTPENGKKKKRKKEWDI